MSLWNEESRELRTTRTFAVLEVSKMAFLEIKEKLEKAGYEHAFLKDSDREGERILIDMHGISITEEK